MIQTHTHTQTARHTHTYAQRSRHTHTHKQPDTHTHLYVNDFSPFFFELFLQKFDGLVESQRISGLSWTTFPSVTIFTATIEIVLTALPLLFPSASSFCRSNH